jgi:hypothetical protein
VSAGLKQLAAKEARALWPTCGAAAATVALTSFTYPRFTPLAYALGALALGAQSFGHEYGYRTLGTLLMQPLDRRKIFAIKIGALALMLVLLASVTWLALANGRRWDPVLVLSLPPLGAVAFGPWLTMLCRNQLAGALFSGVPAGVVLAAAQWIAYQVHVTDDDAAALLIRQIWFGTMAVITPIAAVVGWRLFLRLEALEGNGRAIQLPSLFKGRTPPYMMNPVLQLIMKELTAAGRLDHSPAVRTRPHLGSWRSGERQHRPRNRHVADGDLSRRVRAARRVPGQCRRTATRDPRI